MTIQTGISAVYRYPGAYIQINGSQAGLGGDIPGVLLVGQKLAAGTAPAGEVVRVTGVQDAIAKAGAGSMLAQMAKRYRDIDPAFDLYMLPYDDVGEAGSNGSIQFGNTGIAANGTLALYIASRRINVPIIAAGATGDSIALAAQQAIADAGDDIPVTAGVVGGASGILTLTAKHLGTCGDNIDIRLGLYGEETPAGLTVAITAMSGGSGDPAPGDLTAMLGNRWYRYIALGINDAVTLAAWHAESQRRYLPPIQAGFRAFAAFRGDYDAAAAFGEATNYEHISTLSLEINPIPTWESAAMVCAAAAPRLYANPTQSLEGVPLPGMIGVSYHDFTNANSLLYKGMSIMQVARDGSCSIKRLVSMYQFRPDGSADDAFLDINTAEVMERIRYEQRMGAIKRFTGTSAAKSNEGFKPGLRITTVDDVRAYLLSLYQHTLMAEYGWVQEYDYYKANLLVEQDPQNPSRFNFADDPVLLSPYYILAGISQFRKAV
jgi:phage tail sheath gpL-like